MEYDPNEPSSMAKCDDKVHERNSRISEMLSKPPSPDYVQLTTNLTQLYRAVQQQIVAQLEPALKAHIQRLPHATYEEKKSLTKWANGELRRYGLAIRWEAVEKTGDGFEKKVYPAILASDVGNHPKEGRFQLEYMSQSGKKLRPISTAEMPRLLDYFRLMIDDPERRRSGKWTDHVVKGVIAEDGVNPTFEPPAAR
jgi:hypothetical protein